MNYEVQVLEEGVEYVEKEAHPTALIMGNVLKVVISTDGKPFSSNSRCHKLTVNAVKAVLSCADELEDILSNDELLEAGKQLKKKEKGKALEFIPLSSEASLQ